MKYRRYILVKVLLLSVYTVVTGQQPQTSLQELGLNGKVESLITERYKVTNLANKKIKKEKDCFDSQSYCFSLFFDRNGMLVQEFEYDNEDIIYIHKSTYNDSSAKINYDSFSKRNNKIQQNYHRIFTYNQQNQLENFSVYIGKDTLAHKIIYQYNDKGQRTETANYNSQDILIRRYVYTYNQDGNKIKEQGCDHNFVPTLSIQYEYDPLTHLKTKENHYSGEELTYQRFFYYNEDNLLSEQVESDIVNHAELYKTTYRYNMSQQLVETILTYNNDLFKRSLYEYDLQGNRIQEIIYQREKNKWILKYIIEHTIKYY